MKRYKKLIALLLSLAILFNISTTVFSEDLQDDVDTLNTAEGEFKAILDEQPIEALEYDLSEDVATAVESLEASLALTETSESSGAYKVWDFSDGNWSLGDYTSEYGYDLGYIGAGTAISKVANMSYEDFVFTHALRLSRRSQTSYLGTGETINLFPTDGYMRFKVGGDSEITVYARWADAVNPDGTTADAWAGVVYFLRIFDDITASDPSFDGGSLSNSDVLSMQLLGPTRVYKNTVTYKGPSATLYMYASPGNINVLRVEASNVVSDTGEFPETPAPTSTPTPSNEPTPTPKPSSGGGGGGSGGGGGGATPTATPTPEPTEAPAAAPTETPLPSPSSSTAEETPAPAAEPVNRSALKLKMASVNISLAEGSKKDSPVYNVTVSSDYEGSTVFDKHAMANVEIPFTPDTDKDNTEKIVVYKIDEDGNKKIVTTSHYDDKAGRLIFKSAAGEGTYEIAYVDKTFEDLSDYPWAKHGVEFLASKGIVNGINDELFAPANPVKRGDFMLMLMKSLGLDGKADNNFNDVPEDSYYADSIGVAKELQITAGDGRSSFNPEAYIERQDMMVLVANTLTILDVLEPATGSDILLQFEDNDEIRSYAAPSVSALVEAEIVSGKGRLLDPCGNTTRAEAAVLIYKLFSIINQ